MLFIAKCRNQDDSRPEIEMALREALANAIVHGNQEGPHTCVYVMCRCTAHGEVSIEVQDEGQGFEISTVTYPTTPENLLDNHGRGVYLMKTLMDEVHFEQGGALVYMRKNPNAGIAAKRKAG